MREKFNLKPKDRVIIYAGKLDTSKGIDVLINAIKEKFKCAYNPMFLFIGNPSQDFNFIEQIAEINNRFIHLDTQKYIDLPKYFHMSDIFVFPAQNSLTFYDAQAASLPCILSLDTVNEARVKFNNGITFKIGDSQDLRDKISFYLNLSNESLNSQKLSSYDYVSKDFNYEDVAKKYLYYINQTISIFNENLYKG